MGKAPGISSPNSLFMGFRNFCPLGANVPFHWHPSYLWVTALTMNAHFTNQGPVIIFNYFIEKKFKGQYRGFPGGAVGENLPAGAGDTGSSPGLGRSHMPRSNWAREPQLLSLRVWSLCSATREAATVRGTRTAMKSGPRSPQLEKALAQK